MPLHHFFVEDVEGGDRRGVNFGRFLDLIGPIYLGELPRNRDCMRYQANI
jgi:hypothetical protein